MPTLSFAPASVAHGNVPDWLHLQFLCGPSGIESSQTLGKGLYSCHGQWLDRSCLEYLRSVTLQSGTVAVGRTETTWTTKKAGTPNRHAEQTSELPIACSAFGSSSQGGQIGRAHV